MSVRRRLTRAAGRLLVLGAVAVAVPHPSVSPPSISLSTVETATAVDFRDDVFWVLALGSDARPGTPIDQGDTDAIELIGINPRTGHATGIGIPRDSLVPFPDGPDRINTALARGGPAAAARAVSDLVGITADFVMVTGFDGFTSMVDSVDGVTVRSAREYRLDDVGLEVRRGRNTFDADQALDFARSRDLVGDDFARVANHQQLLLGLLRRLDRRADEPGLLEGAALAAISGLETDLSPRELYRLAQAVTLVDPARVDACVVLGTPGERDGASIVVPDEAQAARIGADARDDARLQGGCRVPTG